MALNIPPSTFTPVAVSENPRLWKGDIGLMNTSKTSVVFTLESLIGFLKTHQVEVDSNYNEFKNLPKYASLGKMEATQVDNTPLAAAVPTETANEATIDTTPALLKKEENSTYTPVQEAQSSASAQTQAAPATHQGLPVPARAEDVFIPTRKVRQVPGGGTLTIGNLFGGDDEPVMQNRAVSGSGSVLPEESTQGSASSSAHRAQDAFIPTRKVRQVPGGGTLTIGNLFGGDDEPAPNRRVASGGSSVLPENSPAAGQDFIPTRKVRQPPGGGGEINAIFGH